MSFTNTVPFDLDGAWLTLKCIKCSKFNKYQQMLMEVRWWCKADFVDDEMVASLDAHLIWYNRFVGKW